MEIIENWDEVGKLLRRKRKEAGIKQGHVASKAGYATNHLSNVECGNAPASLNVVRRVLEVLGYELVMGVKKIGDDDT